MGYDELCYIYFNDSACTMGIGTPLGLLFPEYPAGQELLNFIDLDLTEYEYYRILLNKYFNSEKTRGSKEIENLILPRALSVLSDLAEKPTSVDNLISSHNMSSFLFGLSPELKKHPFCFLCIGHKRDVLNENGLDLLFFQNHFKELINFCFDQSYNPLLNQLSAKERYFLWKTRNESPFLVTSMSNINCRTNITFVTTGASHNNNLGDLLDGEISQQTIDLVKNSTIIPLRLFYCNTPVEYAFCEFDALITMNVKMKRCKRCGKYFILKGDYNTDYCDRVLPGQKISCKKAAAIDARKLKVKENPILQEYQRAYKRMYARITARKLSQKDFKEWSDKASRERDSIINFYGTNPPIEVINSFKKYLGNQ